jgi:hypothetical protein
MRVLKHTLSIYFVSLILVKNVVYILIKLRYFMYDTNQKTSININYTV